MAAHTDDHQRPTIVVLDGLGGSLGIVVAESAEHLWLEVQAALRRRRATNGGPKEAADNTSIDFVAAMRLVEAEVYDAA